jgi:hypothetical protein
MEEKSRRLCGENEGEKRTTVRLLCVKERWGEIYCMYQAEK